MVKVLVVAVLVGTLISVMEFAQACDNFCRIVEENVVSKKFYVRDFLVNSTVNSNTDNGITEIKRGVNVMCLEIKLIACGEQVFCLGCCNLSTNQTYHGYRTREEIDYRCGSNDFCRDDDLKQIKTGRGCELFLE